MRFSIVALIAAVAVTACSPKPPADTEVFSIDGYVHAGPTCPAMQEPPDPACEDRPVGDAELIVAHAAGDEVVRVRTDGDGRFSLDLPAGTYTLIPQPVEGLMGTASSQDFTVPGADSLDVPYDTGIR